MNPRLRATLFVLVLGLAATGGFLTWRLLFGPPSESSAALTAGPVALAAIGSRRPDFRLPDLDGVMREAAEWDGKVLVVNFWATWCAPCRREMPGFVTLQEQYGERGLQFVGIAMDERDAIAKFVKAIGVNYPTLVGDMAALELTRRYGNRLGTLPYTVIVDRQGTLVFAKGGELDRRQAEAAILSFL